MKLSQTAKQRSVLFMFNQIEDCSNGKPVDYQVIESYLGFVISNLPVKADDLDTAKRFASNNRRQSKTLIEIVANGKVVVSQETCFDQWIEA